jgi:arginine/lysine/ornithine decarboxylase
MIYDIPTPESVMTLREASLAAHRTVMLEDAVGLICASPLYPYPPGVPAVMPGELISKEAANLLLNSGVSTASVVVKP